MILKKPDGLFGELYMNWYMLYSFFDGIVDVGFDEDSADADVIAAVDECWMLVWSACKVMSRTTLICYKCTNLYTTGQSVAYLGVTLVKVAEYAVQKSTNEDLDSYFIRSPLKIIHRIWFPSTAGHVWLWLLLWDVLIKPTGINKQIISASVQWQAALYLAEHSYLIQSWDSTVTSKGAC